MPQDLASLVRAAEEREREQRAGGPVRAAGAALYTARTGSQTPQAAAIAQETSRVLGVPPMLVDRQAEQEARAQRDLTALAAAPRTAAFLSDEQNAAVAHDQVEGLSGLERALVGVFGNQPIGPTRDAILSRQLGGGLVTGLGSIFGGLSDVVDFVDRRVGAPLGAQGNGAISGGLDYLGTAFKTVGSDISGRPLSGVQQPAGMTYQRRLPTVAPNATGLTGDVAEGLGQISGQILVGAATGGIATLPALYAQGVDQMDDRVRADMARDGRTERTAADDLATQAGGVVTAVTEKIGLDRILRAVPSSVRGRIMGRLTDIAVAGVTEGATEALEQVGQNALAINLLGEDAKGGLGYIDQAAEQAAPASLVGSIARLAVMAAVPGVQHVRTRDEAAQTTTQHDAFQKAVESVTSNPLLERAPERLRQFLAGATENASVFVPASTAREFFQSHPDLDVWLDEWDVRDQYEQAVTAGTDIEIPTATYLTKVALSEAHAAFSQDLRLSPDAMSLREAQDFEQNGEENLGAAVDTALQQGVQEQEAEAPVERVRADIFDQLRSAGVSVEVARQNAVLVASRARTRAERSPGLYADAWEAYTADGGLRVQAEVPASVQRERDRLDVVLEVMRNRSAQPTQRTLKGQTLLEFLADNGGVTDTGGELAAMGAGAFNRPSQGGRRGARPVIRAEGGNAFGSDYAAQRAVEAGYLPEGSDGNALFEAVREELAGRPVYSASYARDAQAETTLEAAADLEALLPTLGLDDTATNEEIRAAIQKMGDADGASFNQTAPIDQTQTPEFKAWFGDSKVVDKKGRPLVVYHGTPDMRELNASGVFSTSDERAVEAGFLNREQWGERARTEAAYFFTPDLKAARSYTDTRRSIARGEKKPGLVPSYISLQNPADVDFAGERWTGTDAAIAKAKADGHDGIIIRNVRDHWQSGIVKGDKPHMVVVAFSPEQIKSATANSGAFNPRDPSIFNQDDDAIGPKRGNITFTDAGATITLFRAKDRSTFLHEISHKWLDELVIDGTADNAAPEVKADLDRVLAWFSDNAGQPITVDDIGVDQHELWARGGEVFFMEGKAPSAELRPAFRRFTEWLKGVYRSVLSLNAPVSQPVREVMGRLIATDDEISAAQEAQSLNRLFSTPEAAGMTKDEFARYTAADATAQAEASARLMKTAMTKLRRERTMEWKNERESLRERQTEIVDALPDIAAMRTLNETGERINRQALIDLYGSDRVLKLLPRGRTALYADDGTVHPDALADAVGARSGEDLINALMSNQAERQARKGNGDNRSVREARIEDRLDAEMEFLHGDPLNDGTLEEEALNAVHEKRRAALLATEASQLAKLAGTQALWTREGIEAYARDTILNLRAAKLRPGAYLRAERRAGIDAQRALLKGKHAEALDAKLLQSVNFALYRSALDAVEAIEKGEALFARVISAKEKTGAKARNWDIVTSARSILAGYGLARKGGEPVANYMAALQAYDPDAWAALDETVNDALAIAKPVEELTVAEHQDLTATIEQLWSLSRETQVMVVAGQREELEAVRATLTEELSQYGPAPVRGGKDKAVTAKERAGRRLLSGRHLLGRVEEWAIRKGPAFTKYVARPVFQAGDAYRTMERTHMPTLEAAYETLRPDVQRTFKIEAPEIGYTFGEDGGNGIIELIGALRHVGNPSNYRKLLLGREWGTVNEDGSLDDSRFRALLDRLHRDGVLLERHWQFVQSEWDLHEAIKPEVQKAHRRMTGRYFEEVTAAPVTTPFGVFAGGYVPAKVDPEIDSRAAELDVVSILANGAGGSLSFPYPSSGFTKARVEHNKPLNLDVRQAMSQFGEAMRYATLGPAVLDVSRVLRERTFADTLDAYDRDVWNEMLLPWLTRSVAQRTSQPSASAFGRAVENTVGRVVSRTGTALMFANVLNASQQVTGALPATLRTGNRNMAFAARSYLMDPAGVTASVVDMSPMMANRMGSQMRDLSDTANQIVLAKPGVAGAYQAAVDWSDKHKYWMQKGVQNFMDPIVWTAAYNRGVELNEADPVAYADSVIRTTQDSYAPENAPGYLAGPKWAQAFTQFSGWFNTQVNLQVTEAAVAIRDQGLVGASPRLLQIAAMGTLIPAIASEIIAQALRGTLGDEKKDGWWDDLSDIFLMSSLRYALAYVPFVGQLGNAVINRFDDKPYNDKLSIAPVFSTVEAPISLAVDVTKAAQGKGDASRTVKDFGTTFTTITGIPLMNRQAGYVADVLEGDVEPMGPVDAVRGFVSGAASEESRTDR